MQIPWHALASCLLEVFLCLWIEVEYLQSLQYMKCFFFYPPQHIHDSELFSSRGFRSCARVSFLLSVCVCVYVIFHVRKAWFLNIWESPNHGAWNPVERHGLLKFPRGTLTVLNILTLLSGDLSGERSLFGKQGLFAILSMKPLIYLLSFGSPRERCHAPWYFAAPFDLFCIIQVQLPHPHVCQCGSLQSIDADSTAYLGVAVISL